MTNEELLALEESQTLHCTICQEPIPDARARRQTSTCSEKCKNRLDAIRAHQRASKRCPYCLHPSTPEEREAFRLWRVERGEVRSANKYNRDAALPPRQAMVRILRKAILAIAEERDRVKAHLEAENPLQANAGAGNGHSGEALDRVDKLTSLIAECESVLPAPRPVTTFMNNPEMAQTAPQPE